MLPFQVQLMLQEQQVQVALAEGNITPIGASCIRRNPTQASEDNSEQLLAPAPSTGRHRNHQMLLAAQSIYGGSESKTSPLFRACSMV